MPKQSVTNERVVGLIKEGIESHGVRGLARAVGISPAIITRYAQGKVGEPSQATLEKLAAYFGVSVSWLREEAGSLYDGLDLIPRKESIISVKQTISVGAKAVDKYLEMIGDEAITGEIAAELGISLNILGEECVFKEAEYEVGNNSTGEILDVLTKEFKINGKLIAANSFSRTRRPRN